MTFGSAPGTGISRAHSSGTAERPISRAATAGNSASRSGVRVKMQLTRSAAPRRLRARISRISSSVAARIAAASFSVTVLAPRSAISRMARGFKQPLDLGRRQAAVLAGLQAAEAQRAEGDPLERADRVPDGLAHALDLALAALVDGQLDAVGPEAAGARRRREPVLELHALAQRAQRRLADRRVTHPRAVGPRDLEGRVREPVREVAVVGDQDEAGAVG